MENVEDYLRLNGKYFKEAEALMGKGDYVQASEKFWGAAAEIVKALAAKKGMVVKSHGELFSFVSGLKDELGDPELPRLFSLASALHQNFYEDWLPPATVRDHGEAVKEFVERFVSEAHKKREEGINNSIAFEPKRSYID